MGTNAGLAGGTTSDPALPIWTWLDWKLKTGLFFLHIIMLQGCYQAWNRCVRTWYVNTFFSVMYGCAPVGQHLMEVGLSRLPYLPQTVSKEQSSRKGKKEEVLGRATGQKATGLLLVSDSHRPGHTKHTTRSFTSTGRHSPFWFPFAALISLCSVLFSG